MPAKAHTQAPANPKTGPLLERLIRKKRPVLEAIAARKVRPDQVEDAIQAACLGFLRAFDPDAATGGEAGALRYLKTSVDNSAAKIIRGETRRVRGLPPSRQVTEGEDPVDRAVAETCDPVEFCESRSEIASYLGQLRELPSDQRRALILRAAGYEPAEARAHLASVPQADRNS